MTIGRKTPSLTHPTLFDVPFGGDHVGSVGKFWYPRKHRRM